MDNQLRQELYDLLFGEDGPDISLVFELAAVLPESLLEDSIRMARAAEPAELRPPILAALASRLTGWKRTQVLRTALEETAEIQPERRRVGILVDLAPQLSAELLGRALSVVSELQFETSRGSALISLARYLDETRLGQALAIAQKIEHQYPRAKALTGIAQYLTEEGPETAPPAVSAPENVGLPSPLLAMRMPYLPRALRLGAFQTVFKGEAERERARRLREIVPQITERFLEEVLAAVREVNAQRARAAVLASLRAPRTLSFAQMLGRVREIDDGALRMRALVSIVPLLPESLLEEALDLVLDTASETNRAFALYRLAGLLPPGQWSGRIILACLEIESQETRARLLPALLTHTRGGLRETLIREALFAARSIEYDDLRAESLISLLDYPLPEAVRQEALDHARAAARGIRFKNTSAMMLARLGLKCLEPLRTEVHIEALRTAQAIDDEKERAYTLADICGYLSEPRQAEALRTISEVEDERWRAHALTAMVYQLSEKHLPVALALMRKTIDKLRKSDLLAAFEQRAPKLLSKTELESARAYRRTEFANDIELITAKTVDGERGRALLSRVPEQERPTLLVNLLYAHELYYGARELLKRDYEVEGGHVSYAIGWEMRPIPQLTEAAPVRTVNNGFSPVSEADTALDRMVPLKSSEEYYFWLEIGPPLRESIAEQPTPIPLDLLPEEIILKVVLFPFRDQENQESGIHVDPLANVGELRVQKDGSVTVVRQPTDLQYNPPKSDRLARRLFFPVRTPKRAGDFRLRCSIYFERTLVQSWLIRARVMRVPRQAARAALRSRPDFTLSQTLTPTHLAQMQPHLLSLMLNSSGNSTHGFLFAGDGNKEIRTDLTLDAHELQSYIRLARNAMRTVSWGSHEEFDIDDKSHQYRYDSPAAGQLAPDLARLAAAGLTIYSSLAGRLDEDGKKDLEGLMRNTGRVQIALKESPRFILPAALFYDYPFDSNAYSLSEYRLCETFASAMRSSASLEDCECFKGACPVRDKIDELLSAGRLVDELGPVICPSGFWGYRHSLGLPLSMSTAPDSPQFIYFQGEPSISVGVSTDPVFRRRLDHQANLEKIRVPLGWSPPAEDRRAVMLMLKQSKSQLIYFYCHGGVTYPDYTPYIEVGRDEGGITPTNLASNRISWSQPQPLVFINGCHTTALEPEVAIEFVSYFVRKAHAAGVVGTEITIFEQLACEFAEECLKYFFGGSALGDAVRRARLALLKAGNPLGLLYIPYATANLALKEQL